MARAEGKSQNPTAAPREFVRVYNTESEAAPAMAALEVCGYDKSENLFYVCKPTVSGRNDCLFNTRTPIAPNGTGQAVATGPKCSRFMRLTATRRRPGKSGVRLPARGRSRPNRPATWCGSWPAPAARRSWSARRPVRSKKW